MCSIVVFASDHAKHPDPATDASSVPKRGHVIDVSDDDDAHWGNAIHDPNGLGWWRVIVLPGEPASKYAYLCRGDEASHPLDQSKDVYPRHRVNVLDLDAIERRASVDKVHRIRLPKGTDILPHLSVVRPAPVSGVIGKSPLVIG